MKDNIEKQILEILESEKFARIEVLSEKLSTSPSTVRRKLALLQANGLVERLRGGAKLCDQKNYFPKFSFRSHVNSLEKKKIALAAIKLIKDGDVIFLDGSTSAFFIAEYLSEFKNIKVYTNGIDTLSILSKYNVTAYSTGGQISSENPSVLIGNYASKMIENIRADLSFFSAQSVNQEGEIFDCFEHENFLRQTMIKNSAKSVFLCDSTKFGKTSPFYLCNLNDIDYIVSDKSNDGYFTAPIKAEFIHL